MSGSLPPIPATFDFRGNYAATVFCFNNPLSAAGPVLLAGWIRLVGAFAGAMSDSSGNPSEWQDMGFSENWLTSRAYADWRWSKGSPRLPVYLEVPFKGGKVGPGNATLLITAPITTVASLNQDFTGQGVPLL